MVKLILWLIFHNRVHTQMTYLRKYDMAQKSHLKSLVVFTCILKYKVAMMETLGSEHNYEKNNVKKTKNNKTKENVF